jgi:ion channel POLLUX/CASTOR
MTGDTAGTRHSSKASRRGRSVGSTVPVAQRRPTKVSSMERVRYRFEQTLSRGPARVIGWLALLTLIIIVLAGLIELALGGYGGASNGFGENLWQSMLRVLDSGAFASDSDWPTRLLAFLVTVSGIFIAGSLIGLIATSVDRKIEDLSKGRSRVIESHHSVILGWSEHIGALINELTQANESAGGLPIVVLASRDKAEMERDLYDRVPNLRGSELVVRSGNPAAPDDLRRVNIDQARSVIVLRSHDGDPGVVKAVLALRNVDPDFGRTVVAELSDEGTAQLLRSVTDGRVVTVNSDKVIAGVTAQSCRQQGLAQVYRELLDFDGDEMYIATVPQCGGRRYDEAQFGFATSTLIGICWADGHVTLNPAADTLFSDGDQVVVVAADDDTVVWNGDGLVASGGEPVLNPSRGDPVRVLMVGWSALGSIVVRELDDFVATGSVIHIVADPDIVELPAGEDLATARATVTVSPIRVDAAAGLDPSGYDQVIVLGYREGLELADADSRTLLTLLSLRRRLDPSARIVGEILDPANVVLAQSTGADDFIVSDELAALMVAQLSEQPRLQAVFDDLFDASGSVIVANTAAWYVPNRPIKWASVVASAVARSETALGVRISATGQVRLNLAKDEMVTMSDLDSVIVIAGRN